MPSIYVESGIEEGAAYGFPPGDVVFIVGRAPNSGIVITDPLVSRQHCRIERIGGRYRVVDLGSHNGTCLNDQQMVKNSTREISFGDVVRIGETEMTLREEAPDDEGELAGRRLGGYQLVKRIGSGGMGEVYRAVQVALGRQVAIKILSPELTEDRTFVDRFMTEARAAGKLNHPNVAQVHEVGESDGIYYYSMEYLAGGSVQERIRGGRALELAESIKVVLGCARALEYAEKHGVIHCDIKPDNLMLTEDDEVRLTDLGIARTVKSMAEKVKQEGGVLGSPHYMAPEQARGEPIDHRVDIYALGATFYRVISGRTPFSGKNAREIMEKQVYEEPAGLRSINPEIPQAVCRVVTRMMKKKPEKRYQHARELIKELERLQEELAPLTSDEIGVATTRHQSRTMRRARRRSSSGPLLILAVVVLAILAGGAFVALRGGKVGEQQLQLWMRRAAAEEDNGRLEHARSFYVRVRDMAPEGSLLRRKAAAEVDRIEEKINRQQTGAAVESRWGLLQEMKAKAEKSGDLSDTRKLIAAYARFVEDYPNTSKTAAARLAIKTFTDRNNRKAMAKVREFEARAAELARGCRFDELQKEWAALAARYAGLPAGKHAAGKSAAAAKLGDKALEAAEAAAEKALAAKKFDEVLPPLERLTGSDDKKLNVRAAALVESFKQKIARARERLEAEAERRRKLAACKALRDAAVKLARNYRYVPARVKFVEAQIACRRAGFDEELELTRKLADEYWDERVLFQRLGEYSSAGGLRAAMAVLGDGRKALVISASSTKLTYRHTRDEEESVEWKDVPVSTVYDLLSRPKLKVGERIVLAYFALHRGLTKEARKQLARVLQEDPQRKKEVAPLREAIDKAGTATKK